MKKIESANREADGKLSTEIKDFWTRNVNAERIMGKNVTHHERGSENYFSELEIQRYRSHQHLLPWIKSMVPGKSVLEIGSGVGLDTFTLATHGLNVTAVDLTEVGIATVKKRFSDNQLEGHFAVANGCILPFPDNTFNYVYSFGVLHHAADTQQAINECYRVLKPGGEARIMLYHRHSLNELVHRITGVPFEDKNELCPVVRRFTLSETRKLFSSFSQVSLALEYAFGEGYGPIFKITPRRLYNFISHRFGWHIMISATK